MKKTVGYVMLGLLAAAAQGMFIMVGLEGGPGAWVPLWMEGGIAYVVAAIWLLH